MAREGGQGEKGIIGSIAERAGRFTKAVGLGLGLASAEVPGHAMGAEKIPMTVDGKGVEEGEKIDSARTDLMNSWVKALGVSGLRIEAVDDGSMSETIRIFLQDKMVATTYCLDGDMEPKGTRTLYREKDLLDIVRSAITTQKDLPPVSIRENVPEKERTEGFHVKLAEAVFFEDQAVTEALMETRGVHAGPFEISFDHQQDFTVHAAGTPNARMTFGHHIEQVGTEWQDVLTITYVEKETGDAGVIKINKDGQVIIGGI